jgi:Fe-S cluster assembly ATP-binding protein
VHVFAAGRVIASGGTELAEQIDANGYESFLAEAK